MRVELQDFEGQIWYVESDQHIDVKQCSNCGKPLEVKILALEPTPISHVIFRNAEGDILGVFDTEAWPFTTETHLNPSVCHFCGFYPSKVKEI